MALGVGVLAACSRCRVVVPLVVGVPAGQEADRVGFGGAGLGGVDAEYLAEVGVDSEVLVGQRDLADEWVPEGLRAGPVGSHVVGRPAGPEFSAAGRELSDQFGEIGVVRVAA